MFEEQLALMGQILLATLPVFLIVLTGCGCRYFGLVTETSERSLMRVVLLVLYPCFILSKIPGNESLGNLVNVALALGCGMALTSLGLLVAYLTGVLWRMEPGKTRNTFTLATAIQNYGFIPIPLLMALFPDRAEAALGVLFVHNLGLELVLWTAGIVVVSGSHQGALKRLINGPSVAILIGLLLNFTGAYRALPAPLVTSMNQLGDCCIPISLLLVGVSLAGVLMSSGISIDWRVITGSLMARFLVLPIAFLSTALLMTGFPELHLVLLVEAAMPAAIFPIVIAKHFDGEPSVAVQVCIATSVASLLMTPVLLVIGILLSNLV